LKEGVWSWFLFSGLSFLMDAKVGEDGRYLEGTWVALKGSRSNRNRYLFSVFV